VEKVGNEENANGSTQETSPNGFIRMVHKFMSSMNAIGTIWVVSITVLITCDILGRALFNSPIIGVPEIVKVSIVGIVWLQMAHTLRIGGHLRSEVVLARLPLRGRAIVDLVASVLGIIIFASIVFSGWDTMIEAWRGGEFEGELPVRVPTYPVRSIVLLGAALTAIQFFLILAQTTKALWGRERKGRG
jgi:TRAP-type C4-dicarboxylate transport system permease small subunit